MPRLKSWHFYHVLTHLVKKHIKTNILPIVNANIKKYY